MDGKGPPKPRLFGRRTRLLTTIVVVAMLGIVVGMIFAPSSALLAPLSSSHSVGQSAKNQVLSIGGTETIKVLGPDGRLVSTWKGPDPLTPAAINAITACLLGQTDNAVFAYCPASSEGYSWIQQVEIYFGSSCTFNFWENQCGISDATAANTLTLNGQAGCVPATFVSSSWCNGWITEATFGPGTFTSTNCPTTCALQNVQTELPSGTPPNGPGGLAFDYLCTSDFVSITLGDSLLPCTLTSSPATMSPGDSLLVTIQFTVS